MDYVEYLWNILINMDSSGSTLHSNDYNFVSTSDCIIIFIQQRYPMDTIMSLMLSKYNHLLDDVEYIMNSIEISGYLSHYYVFKNITIYVALLIFFHSHQDS